MCMVTFTTVLHRSGFYTLSSCVPCWSRSRRMLSKGFSSTTTKARTRIPIGRSAERFQQVVTSLYRSVGVTLTGVSENKALWLLVPSKVAPPYMNCLFRSYGTSGRVPHHV